MVNTTLTLTDSGYRRVPSTGSETVIANSGNPITLRAVSLTLSMSTLINDEPTKKFVNDDDTQEFDFGEVDKNGLNMPVWKVKGVLNMEDTSDQTTLANLIKCVKTKGYKKLGTTDDASNKIFLRWTDETPVSSINVRIKSFSCEQVAGTNKVKYEFTFVETN